jgi:hypothetical protein
MSNDNDINEAKSTKIEEKSNDTIEKQATDDGKKVKKRPGRKRLGKRMVV